MRNTGESTIIELIVYKLVWGLPIYRDKAFVGGRGHTMKKVSLRIRRFDNEQFLTFNIDNEANLDEEVLDFIEEEEPKGLVPVIFEEDEEFDTFSYDITDRIRISELSEQEINAEMVLRVLHSLVLALMDMTEYRIPLSYLVLHRNYIYVDSDYKITFICIPLEEMREEVDLNSFLRSFLANLRFEPSENGDYVARLFTYINNQAVFNLRNLVTLIEDLMADMGIEIPEDESAEIYAEYQEVEEAVEGSGEDKAYFEENDDKAVSFDIYEDEEENLKDRQETAFTEENDYDNIEDNAEGYEDADLDAYVSEENADLDTYVSEENADLDTYVSKENADLDTYVSKEDVDLDVYLNEEDSGDSEDTDREQVEAAAVEEQVDKNSHAEREYTEVLQEEPEVLKKEVKKKPKFKTKKESPAGIVIIDDEFEEFLAEKEYEDRKAHHEEGTLKIKKNIKVNRASIVQNTIEELKAEEQKARELKEAEEKEEERAAQAQSEGVLDQIEDGDETEQNPEDSTDEKVKEPPKINPYLIRVNTEERIIIYKQNFKIGKSNRVDYKVEGNGAVSRVHAIIVNRDGEYYIKDNKSTNHTYVNGKEVRDGEGELLTHDSKIVLGDEEFVFKLS